MCWGVSCSLAMWPKTAMWRCRMTSLMAGRPVSADISDLRTNCLHNILSILRWHFIWNASRDLASAEVRVHVSGYTTVLRARVVWTTGGATSLDSPTVVRADGGQVIRVWTIWAPNSPRRYSRIGRPDSPKSWLYRTTKTSMACHQQWLYHKL